MLRSVFLFSLVLLAVIFLPGQNDLPHKSVVQQEFSEKIDTFAQRAMKKIGAVPGLAISVVSEDSIIYEGAWGYRDVKNKLPVTTETGFYIASSTKSYVALLTLLLDKEGVVDLNAPLTSCIPDLGLNNSVDPDEKQLIDLLRHTQRFENNWMNHRTAYTDFMNTDEMLRHLDSGFTRIEDDKYYDYDNIGYLVTDLCLRFATGRSWKELLESRVLIPAGLYSTTAYMSEAAGTGNLALPHRWNGTEFRVVPPKTDDIMHAAGGLVTTVKDGGQWIRIHLGSGNLDGKRIFPEDVVDRMHKRQVDGDRAFAFDITREGYALGWFDGSYRGDHLISHFGGYPGAQAHISFMPERGVGVAAFVNGGGAGSYLLPHFVAGYAYDLLAGRPDAYDRAWKAVEDAAVEAKEAAKERRELWNRLEELRTDPPEMVHPVDRYVGTFTHPAGGVLDISATPDGRLYINWGAKEGDLLYAGNSRFLADWEPWDPPAEVSFDISGSGPAGAVNIGGFGRWTRK